MEKSSTERRTGYGRRKEDEEVVEARKSFSKTLKTIRRLTIIQLIVGLAALIALALAIFEFGNVQENQNNIGKLAKANHTLATEAIVLTREIQQERVQFTLSSCRDTNHKYRNTTRALDKLYNQARSHETKSQQALARANRKGTIFLIHQFEPLTKNCYNLVRKATTVKSNQGKGNR